MRRDPLQLEVVKAVASLQVPWEVVWDGCPDDSGDDHDEAIPLLEAPTRLPALQRIGRRFARRLAQLRRRDAVPTTAAEQPLAAAHTTGSSLSTVPQKEVLRRDAVSGVRNFLPAACLCVHSSCYHPEAELAVPSLLPDENKDTCSSLLGALPFAVRCPFAASAADCRATCALFRAPCESVVLSCSESVLLSCSNSPSWPSRSRCLVSWVRWAGIRSAGQPVP